MNQKNKDKDGSRFLGGKNASEKRVKQHFKILKEKKLST